MEYDAGSWFPRGLYSFLETHGVSRGSFKGKGCIVLGVGLLIGYAVR